MSRVLNAEGADNGLDVGVDLWAPTPTGASTWRGGGSWPRNDDFGEKVSRYLRSQNDKTSALYINRKKCIKIEEIDNLGNYKNHSTLSAQNVSRKIWKWFDFDWQGVRVCVCVCVWYYLEECIQLGWGWRWGRKETFAPCNVNYHLRAWCITTGLLSLNQSDSRVRQIG